MIPESVPSFAARVIGWQRDHGRHGLPWQGTRDAYRIWLSEIMLQQTQVSTARPYYERFVARFPEVAALAAAPEDEVLALWSGLGYYARARNLHRAAREVMLRHAGRFPTSFDALVALPGIGRSTAAAIAAFAGGERRAILDGNVRRVLARHAGIGGEPTSAAVLAALWLEAERRLPDTGIEAYTQGMMDLGADVCAAKRPACLVCPVAHDCVARREDRVAELPTPRARREPRRKRVAMIVALSRGRVLLQKRPPAGIWGGLRSLPEADAAEDIARWVEGHWGASPLSVEPLPPFEHAFTHYTLEALPWRVELREDVAVAQGEWFAAHALAGAALPAPVRRLLDQLLVAQEAVQEPQA